MTDNLMRRVVWFLVGFVAAALLLRAPQPAQAATYPNASIYGHVGSTPTPIAVTTDGALRLQLN